LLNDDVRSIFTLLAGLSLSFLMTRSLFLSGLEPSLNVYRDSSDSLLSEVVHCVVFCFVEFTLYVMNHQISSSNTSQINNSNIY